MTEKLEAPDGYVFVCVHCAKDIGIELDDVGEVPTNEAYELADELDRVLQVSGCDNRVPRMLRQQADRIAELENQLDKCSHHEAMAHQGGYELGKASQIKELSDEEIKTLHEETSWFGISDPIKFARAILKKANKK